MRRIILFISKYENSFDGAKKIQNESELPVEIICIEKFCENDEYNIINKDDIIFFLCASPLIYKVAVNLDNKGYRIINKEYFLKNYTKKEIQVFLEDNNIKVPKLYTENIINNNQFPIFCKENMHTGITMQLYNRNSQNKFFERFDYREFYLEEPIKLKNSKEIKVYCVNEEVFYKNNQKQNNIIINDICKKVIGIFNKIEVCSIDFIYNEEECYLIDFNPSSGFYATDKGRNGFVKYCKNIVSK